METVESGPDFAGTATIRGTRNFDACGQNATDMRNKTLCYKKYKSQGLLDDKRKEKIVCQENCRGSHRSRKSKGYKKPNVFRSVQERLKTALH